MYGDNDHGNYQGTVSRSGGPSLGAVIVGSLGIIAAVTGLDKLIGKVTGSSKNKDKKKK